MILDLNKVKIYVRPGRTDMRKQIDGLAAIVQGNMKFNPFDGSLYLFAGKNNKRLKILYWDKNGFCLWQKRLEKDHFPWPKDETEARRITPQQLRMLLDGIDFWKAHQRLEYKYA